MKAKSDALMLIDDLCRLGRLRDYEAQIIREGIKEFMLAPEQLCHAPPLTQLATMRRTRRLSQKKVAEACGVTIQAVSNWERGKTTPSLDHYAVLNRLFGVGFGEAGS